MVKKICIVTGSRCEYGLLYWLLKAVKQDKALQLQIIATGMHLSHEFGLTYKKILEDGFLIDEKVEMLLSSDTSVGITKSIGLGVIGFADAYARLNPDMVIVLGDRFETLAAAQAAFIARIPLAHIHGGELTLGAYDDGIRHSVTKMSQLHFVATDAYRQRVIQLGEHPDNVFHVGAMVLDSISNLSLLSKTQLAELLGISFKKRNVVVTFHPETLEKTSPKQAFQELLAALSKLEDTLFIFTKGNADTDGRIINDLIDEFCKQNPEKAKAFVELGHVNYLSLLNVVDMAIGNSSSGVIEVPYFKIPTINIGDRQKGRFRPASVIDCVANAQAISDAIAQGFSSQFNDVINKMTLPHGEGKIAQHIIEIIKNKDLHALIKKEFYDLPVNAGTKP